MTALRSHGLAFAATLVTVSVHLHLHAEAYLHILHDNTSALAFGTNFELATFSSRSTALRAIHISIYIQSALGAEVEFLERHVNVGASIRSFLDVALAPKFEKVRSTHL